MHSSPERSVTIERQGAIALLGPRYVDTEIRVFKSEQGYMYQLSYPQFHEQPQPTLYKDWDAILARLGDAVAWSDVWQIEEKHQTIGTERRQ